MEKIKLFFKGIYTAIKIRIEMIIIREKIKECNNRKLLTHKQQFLIRLNNGRFVIVTNKYIDAYNMMYKGKKKPMQYSDLCDLAIYKTK